MPPPVDEEPTTRPSPEREPGSAIGAHVDPSLRPEAPDTEPAPDREPPPARQTRGQEEPASFWRRLGAYLVDSLVLAIPTELAIQAILGQPFPTEIDWSVPGQTLELLWPFAAVAVVIEIFYFAALEGSTMQATLGKRLLSIHASDEDGQRLSFARAAVRNIAKIASALPLGLGFLLIFTSERNQALHDHLASSLVLRGNADEEQPQEGERFA